MTSKLNNGAKWALRCWVLGVCLLITTGCQTRYDLTLNNGTIITAKSKPQLQNNVYHFKDAYGKPAQIHAFRVTNIERRSFGAAPNANAPFNSAKPTAPAK